MKKSWRYKQNSVVRGCTNEVVVRIGIGCSLRSRPRRRRSLEAFGRSTRRVSKRLADRAVKRSPSLTSFPASRACRTRAHVATRGTTAPRLARAATAGPKDQRTKGPTALFGRGGKK